MQEHEETLFKSGANAMKKLEGVGGKLYLTDKALHHIPHKLNIQSAETYIPLDTITEVKAKNDFVLLRNKLIVTTKDGTMYSFRVNHRKIWIQKLRHHPSLHDVFIS
ncbi:hypothetical protein WMZ97_15710 [Lentibacillus sp. N15]|uniref:hypothetical protein n=1 Tax=Lentibacillus songyuanensis TaxID=3136161 RepID=UPI0031BAEAF9